ncbi:hypothetical protein G3I76_60575, partial [Streptomyces sp. SID11233]|nr:hypothetical protein [Streptomyces sp. SID11233]
MAPYGVRGARWLVAPGTVAGRPEGPRRIRTRGARASARKRSTPMSDVAEERSAVAAAPEESTGSLVHHLLD